MPGWRPVMDWGLEIRYLSSLKNEKNDLIQPKVDAPDHHACDFLSYLGYLGP